MISIFRGCLSNILSQISNNLNSLAKPSEVVEFLGPCMLMFSQRQRLRRLGARLGFGARSYAIVDQAELKLTHA